MQASSTGQLSVVAFVANVLGCMARIFTSYQDGAGIAMIRGFVLGESSPQLPAFRYLGLVFPLCQRVRRELLSGDGTGKRTTGVHVCFDSRIGSECRTDPQRNHYGSDPILRKAIQIWQTS